MTLFLVRDKLWNGSINVRVTFDAKEFLVTIPRVSYLPIYFEQIAQYFSHFGDVPQPFWLEYNGIPIKWHLPVGVIYDYYHLPNMSHSESSHTNLELEVNSGNWPPDLIPFYYKGQIDYDRVMMDNFFNQLKQSSFVINGNSKLVMNLSKDNSTAFWAAVRDHNLNQYVSVNKKVLPRKVAKFPIRVYVLGSAVIQLPVVSDGEFGDILDKYPGFEAYIHGISVEELRSLGVEELWRVFRYLDNFLYIVMV